MAAVPSFEERGYFTMCTRYGRVKRVRLQDFAVVRSNGLIAMSLIGDDTLGWVRMSTGDQDVIIVTEDGMAIRFPEREIRVMGRPASGVNGIRLRRGDRVAGMDVIEPTDSDLLIVTQQAFGKRTALEEYNPQGRFGYGVRTLARNGHTGPIVDARAVNAEDDIALITTGGMTLRASLDSIRRTGRATQGVHLMDLRDGDTVASIAIVEKRRQTRREAENALSDALPDMDDGLSETGGDEMDFGEEDLGDLDGSRAE